MRNGHHLIFAGLLLSLWQGNAYADSSEVAIHGLVRFDQVGFSERDEPKDENVQFFTGAVAPTAQLSVTRVFSPTTSFYLDFDLTSSPQLGLAFLQRNKLFGEKSSLMLGQVPSPFCLEYSNSSKWVPFLSRSLAVNAFSPCIGPGANLRLWGRHGVINAAITQPGYLAQKDKKRDDRWAASARVVGIPLLTSNKILQIGGSYSYQAKNEELVFKASEIKGRAVPELLTTKTARSTILARDFSVIGLESSALFGPLQVEGDYLEARVMRKDMESLRFQGWHVQANYFLTGEMRSYSRETASFAGVTPHKPSLGAWQLALRTSSLDLNDRDIRGGSQLNNSLALNWYANTYVKVTANYIHAQIKPHSDGAKRTVHMLGLRLQTTW